MFAWSVERAKSCVRLGHYSVCDSLATSPNCLISSNSLRGESNRLPDSLPLDAVCCSQWPGRGQFPSVSILARPLAFTEGTTTTCWGKSPCLCLQSPSEPCLPGTEDTASTALTGGSWAPDSAWVQLAQRPRAMAETAPAHTGFPGQGLALSLAPSAWQKDLTLSSCSLGKSLCWGCRDRWGWLL